MTAFTLVFFLIRDIFGYGTITFPQWKKIAVLHLPYNSESAGASVLLATIPGSLWMVVAILALYIFVSRKIRIASLSPDSNKK